MKNETKHVMSVTVSTGRPGPSDTPKKPRRKKRAPKKSEVSEPEFGTPSSAKPSHGKPTDNTNNTNKTAKTDTRREWIEDVIWSAPHKDQALGNISTEYSPTVRSAMYRREKSRARFAYRGQMLIAYRTGLILGTVLGIIIGLGAWWLTSLFA